MMRAILLAAGLGTRLRPLSLELPKPAMPLGFHTLAGESLRSLLRAGFSQVALNAHHLANELEASIRRDLGDRMALRFYYEPELLGTAGGIRNIARALGPSDYLVMNGDSLYLPRLEEAIEAHRRSGAFATLLLREADGSAAESITMDGGGWIRGILHAGEEAPRTHSFTGAQIVSARALAFLPERGCIVRDAYIPALERGERLHGHVDNAPFRDLGTVQSYYRAHFEEGRAPRIHPQATIEEGAVVRRSWIGAGARIRSGAVVSDSIVWPGAVWAGGELTSAILTTSGRIVEGD